MLVHKKFSRWKGGAQPASIPILLGGDTVPGAPSYGVSAPVPVAVDASLDNVVAYKFFGPEGWPVHRIAVGYNYKSIGTPVTLPCSVYLYDALTQRWYLTGPTTTVATTPVVLTDGQFTFYDSIVTPQLANVGSQADLAKMMRGASTQALIIVADHAGATAPAGEHEFIVGFDYTTLGY